MGPLRDSAHVYPFRPIRIILFAWHLPIRVPLLTVVPTPRTINTFRVSAVNFKFVAILALVERIVSHGSSTDLRSSVRELWSSWGRHCK
jgi:hypothetical protein